MTETDHSLHEEIEYKEKQINEKKSKVKKSKPKHKQTSGQAHKRISARSIELIIS